MPAAASGERGRGDFFFLSAKKRQAEPLRNRTVPCGKRTWALGAGGGPLEGDGGHTLNMSRRIWMSNEREWLRDNLVHPF